MSRPYLFTIHSYFLTKYAGVAELADALDLGSSGVICAGSSPVTRTKILKCLLVFEIFFERRVLLRSNGRRGRRIYEAKPYPVSRTIKNRWNLKGFDDSYFFALLQSWKKHKESLKSPILLHKKYK